MYITDLYGKQIQITDLPKAIEQAEAFKDFAHGSKEWAAFDNERCRYWNDLYQKLQELEKEMQQQQRQ